MELQPSSVIICAVVPEARALLAQHHPDIVVFGHSHVYGEAHDNGIWCNLLRCSLNVCAQQQWLARISDARKEDWDPVRRDTSGPFDVLVYCFVLLQVH